MVSHSASYGPDINLGKSLILWNPVKTILIKVIKRIYFVVAQGFKKIHNWDCLISEIHRKMKLLGYSL